MDVLIVVLMLSFMIYTVVKESGFLIERRNCSVSVYAHISSARVSGWSKHGRLYTFTVSYEYRGVRYSEDMTHQYRRYAFEEGESITVLVDDANPSRFLAAREKGSAITNLVIMPLLLLVVGMMGFGIIR